MPSRFAFVAAATSVLATAVPAQHPVDAKWAFEPLAVAAPTDAADPIESLIAKHRAMAGLQPNPVADRRTLLRRASFVLTGLPPTPAELDAFVADASPDAFARVVERLLASPHYGEHQARHWLDLARYSDSNGLDENLAFANAFRYRDWVVRAHNDDLPFDRFARLQIAGDLCADEPGVGLDGHVATGFLALGPRMLAEQDKEKLVLDTVDEQLDLVGRTFLGLTIGCARCHDHKFDPISQRDYYALAGIFRSTKAFHDLEHVSKWFDRELASDAAIAARKAAEAARDGAEKELRTATTEAVTALRSRLVADTADYWLAGSDLLAASQLVEAEDARATNLARDGKNWGDADCQVLHSHKAGEQFAEWVIVAKSAGRHHVMVRAAAAESRPMRCFVDGAVIAEQAIGATTGGWKPADQQWHDVGEVELTAGEHVLRLVGRGPHVPHLDALLVLPAVETPGELVPPVVRRFAAVFARPRHPLFPKWTRLQRDKEAIFGRDDGAAGESGARTELATRARDAFIAAAAAVDQERARRRTAAASQPDKKPPDDKPESAIRLADPLLEHARSVLFDRDGLLAVADADLVPSLPPDDAARVAELTAKRDTLAAAVPAAAPTAMCVREDAAKDLPVHFRGNHLTLAETTTPRSVLAVFASFVPPPAMPAQQSGRAEFAAWLFHAEQALPARVLANRIWQRAFGEGLVRSPSNFGVRGDRPVLPELLDWLAADVRAHGWSQKHLWRRILSSRTWQQTCTTSPDQALRDPENRRLARQQRQRLQAESLRDAMLAIGGNLDRTLGGSLLSTGDRGYVTNDQSNDGARYDAPRRSLYLPIIRNAMFDLFAAFDYADPSVHLEQRPQTAVAPQALWLMNAPFVAEQSRHFAARSKDLASDDERITFCWREALVREPSASERQAAHRWLADARANGGGDAAFAGLAHALFASNEFVYVD